MTLVHRVFLEGAVDDAFGPYEPHRVVAHDWGLTLAWDSEAGVGRIHVPWWRVRSWLEIPAALAPASKDPS